MTNVNISEYGLNLIRRHVSELAIYGYPNPLSMWHPRDIYMMCHAVSLAFEGGTELYYEFNEYKDFITTLPGWATIS